mmetsp:Transcript_4356/g.10516  ORF Transcript_4356/g.10516 Transcript_4356/m.10516 type:complete len:475 (+) Transcript_4356:52-1476(+)
MEASHSDASDGPPGEEEDVSPAGKETGDSPAGEEEDDDDDKTAQSKSEDTQSYSTHSESFAKSPSFAVGRTPAPPARPSSCQPGRRQRLQRKEPVEYRRGSSQSWRLGQVQDAAKDGRVAVGPRPERRCRRVSEVEQVWLTLEEQARLVRASARRPSSNQDHLVRLLGLLSSATPCLCDRRRRDKSGSRAAAGRRAFCLPSEPPMCTHCSGTCGCTWLHPVFDLLDQGLEVNGMSFRGDTPLHAATRAGQGRILVTLCNLRADALSSANHHDWTPLHEAAKLGRANMCRILLDFAAIGASGAEDAALGENSEPPSPSAASEAVDQQGTSKATSTLVRLVNAQSDSGSTALIEAAEQDFPEVVEMLLTCRADANVQRKDGTTALMRAAAGGHLDVCKMLLDASCHVCAGNRRGVKPGVACEGRCSVSWHWSVQDANGKSALQYARGAHKEAVFQGGAGYQRASKLVLLFDKLGVK